MNHVRTLAIAMLILATAPSARAQSAAPARPHVELEAKPPDEPSSDSTPEVEITPDTAPDTTQSPPSAASNEPAPIDADQVAHPPEIMTYVVPAYPPKAREQGIEGRVLLSIVVDESGKVAD